MTQKAVENTWVLSLDLKVVRKRERERERVAVQHSRWQWVPCQGHPAPDTIFTRQELMRTFCNKAPQRTFFRVCHCHLYNSSSLRSRLRNGLSLYCVGWIHSSLRLRRRISGMDVVPRIVTVRANSVAPASTVRPSVRPSVTWCRCTSGSAPKRHLERADAQDLVCCGRRGAATCSGPPADAADVQTSLPVVTMYRTSWKVCFLFVDGRNDNSINSVTTTDFTPKNISDSHRRSH